MLTIDSFSYDYLKHVAVFEELIATMKKAVHLSRYDSEQA
jgi:hypothetical protein